MVVGRIVAVAVPLIFVLSALPASPQALPESLLEDDAAGDVMTIAPDGTTLGVLPGNEMVDIVQISVKKGENGMRFGIQVVDTDALETDRSIFTGQRDEVGPRFTFRGEQYKVDFLETTAGNTKLSRYVPALDSFETLGTQRYERIGDMLEVEYPPEWILDANGIPLRHPAELTDVYAVGETSQIILGDPVGRIWFRDRAPDTGTWNGLLTPPDPDQGAVILTPRVPVRASNGGPDVLVFEVEVDNTVDQAVTTFLSATDAPSGWSIRTPARVQLAPGGAASLPVLVTIPGAHAHGTLQTFIIEARDVDGALLDSVELGVKFLDVPQPAGHHDRLYLHQRFEDGVPFPAFRNRWMSTVADDENANGEPIPPTDSSRDGLARTFAWNYELSPELSIGLDFDTSRMWTGSFPVIASMPATGTLTASMRHCDPNDATGADAGLFRCDAGSWFDLASQSQDVSLGQGQQDIEIEAPVTDYADLVPYEPKALLAFHAVLETSDAPVADFHMAAGGEFRLPLLEYRDPVDEAHSGLTALSLQPLGDVERLVPPGGTVWLSLDVTNAAEEPKTLAFTIAGHRAEWAEIHPIETRLAEGDRATVHVAITAPDDAYPGDYADVFIVAEDTADPASVTFQRFRATVDEDAKSDSAPGGLGAAKDTPNVSLALLLLGVLAGARFHRRP